MGARGAGLIPLHQQRIARSSWLAHLILRFTADDFPRFSSILIFNLLPIVERRQSSTFNSGDVNEHVFAATAALWLNETIALGWVEPLHRECSHHGLLEAHKLILRRANVASAIRIQLCLEKTRIRECNKLGQVFEQREF